MRYIIIVFLILILSGCAVNAYQSEDGKFMEASGWGFNHAKFPDGGEIGKKEPIAIPTIPVKL